MANVFNQFVAAAGVSHMCSLIDDGVASNANLRTSDARDKQRKSTNVKTERNLLVITLRCIYE